MNLPRLTLPLLLAALAHSPTALADDWLQQLQKGDWQQAIEGAVNEAAPTRRTQRPTQNAPTPRASPQRSPDATAAGVRAREARAARAAQRAAASEGRSAVKRRSAAPSNTGERAEQRRSRRR